MLRAGVVYSGVGPDYRVLVKKARKQAQAYFLQYRALKPVKALVQDTASVRASALGVSTCSRLPAAIHR